MIAVLRAAIVAILVALLSGLTSHVADAATPASPDMQSYAYDGRHHTAPPTFTTSERGPPAAEVALTRHTAVDPRPHGELAHPQPVVSGSYAEYDHSAQLAPSDRASVTTRTAPGGRTAHLRAHLDVRCAANAGDDVVRALSAAERTTLDDALKPNNLEHIFDPKHNFAPLVKRYGSQEAVLEQFVRNIGGPLPRSGPYEVARSIGGQTVVIRGAVVNGVPRIGTAFTP